MGPTQKLFVFEAEAIWKLSSTWFNHVGHPHHAAEAPRGLLICAGLKHVSKPEIGTKRQCTNCGAKFFDLRKRPIVCPRCGAVYQVATIKAREVFRGATKPFPEAEVENSEAELVSFEEVEEGDNKVAAVAMDDLEVEGEPADDALLPQEEKEVNGDMPSLIDGDHDDDEED